MIAAESGYERIVHRLIDDHRIADLQLYKWHRSPLQLATQNGKNFAYLLR